MLKYNSNYIKNSKKPKCIEKVVNELLGEEINSKPYDFLFRFVGEEYPQTNHDFLNLPGIFKQMESTNVFTKDGKSLQMDLVESILPDDKDVKFAAITNMEHQARKLSPSKIEDIFFYSIFLIGKFKQPCYSYVVTNIDHGAEEIIYEIDGHPLKIHFILFDKQRIYKILNTLIKKNYTIFNMSEMDFVKLNYCIIFAKDDYAKDVIEKTVELFISIEKINHEYQLVLFLALKMMIKYHFRDDFGKTRELLTMITKAMGGNMIEDIPLYQRTKKRLLDAENQIIEKDKTIAEKDKVISDNESALAEKDKVISDNESALAEKDKEIESLKAEIKALKNK
jgi:hypothetical protein